MLGCRGGGRDATTHMRLLYRLVRPTHMRLLCGLFRHTHTRLFRGLARHTHMRLLRGLARHTHMRLLCGLFRHTHMRLFRGLARHTHMRLLGGLARHAHLLGARVRPNTHGKTRAARLCVRVSLVAAQGAHRVAQEPVPCLDRPQRKTAPAARVLRRAHLPGRPDAHDRFSRAYIHPNILSLQKMHRKRAATEHTQQKEGTHHKQTHTTSKQHPQCSTDQDRARCRTDTLKRMCMQRMCMQRMCMQRMCMRMCMHRAP